MKKIYTPEQKAMAVRTYDELKSYSATLRLLGYPSRHVLFDWVRSPGPKPKPKRPEGPAKRYTWETKKTAILRVMGGDDIRDVAADLGVTNSATIYEWVHRWRMGGDIGLMSRKEQMESGTYKTRAQLEAALPDDVGQLKKLAAELMARNAVLERELDYSKKHPGGIPGKLPAKVRTRMVDELRGRFPLSLLLEAVSLPASSYYYAKSAAARPDPYVAIRGTIAQIASESGNTYGSPRIWLALRNRGILISEKVVRRLMRQDHIEVRYARRKCRYSSYIGEVTPAVENLVRGNFHAPRPDMLWLTDITEFSAGDAKVYLKPHHRLL